MNDAQRRQIADEEKEKAKVVSRLEAVEDRTKRMEARMESYVAWGARALWGAAVYMATQIWSFVANGGFPK